MWDSSVWESTGARVLVYVGTGCVISQFNSDCQQNLKNIYTLSVKSIDFYS